MANEAGIRRVKGLYAPHFGGRDLVLFGLAQALAGAMEEPGDGTAMFSDCIALAFFAHIVRAYGNVPAERFARGGLASWQLQRARNSSMPIWLAILRFLRLRMCADCRAAISAGLSNAIRFLAVSMAMKRRVERAKELLRDPDLSLQISRSLRLCRPKPFRAGFFEERGLQPGALAASPSRLANEVAALLRSPIKSSPLECLLMGWSGRALAPFTGGTVEHDQRTDPGTGRENHARSPDTRSAVRRAEAAPS